MSDIDELDEVVATLKSGKAFPPVTIRSFLSWFSVQRRTRLNVEYIDENLAKVGVRTVPNYTDTWVNNSITFELLKDGDPLTDQDLDILRNVSRRFDTLRSMSAF